MYGGYLADTDTLWQDVSILQQTVLESAAWALFLPDKCLSAEVKTAEGHLRHNSFQICACVFVAAVCGRMRVWRN